MIYSQNTNKDGIFPIGEMNFPAVCIFTQIIPDENPADRRYAYDGDGCLRPV